MIRNKSEKEKDIICIMNCLKRYNINSFITIPFMKSNRTILTIVVKDSILVLKKVKDIRLDLININDKLNVEWMMINSDLIEINFKYIDV